MEPVDLKMPSADTRNSESILAVKPCKSIQLAYKIKFQTRVRLNIALV